MSLGDQADDDDGLSQLHSQEKKAPDAEAMVNKSFINTLECWSTSRLQDKLVDLRGTVLEDNPSTAAELKLTVLQNRMKRQEIYVDKLKRIAQEYKRTFANTSWDRNYANWIKVGDALVKFPRDKNVWIGPGPVTTVRQPLLRSRRWGGVGKGDQDNPKRRNGYTPDTITKMYDGPVAKPWSRSGYKNDRPSHYFPESAYELDLNTPGWATGAILLENESLTLRWMCELGDRLQIDPAFFVEHFCRPHPLVVRHNFPQTEGPFVRWTGDMRDYCYMDGALVRTTSGESSFATQRAGGFTGVSAVDLDKAHVRVSCVKVDAGNPLVAGQSSQTVSEPADAFFVVVVRNAHKALSELPASLTVNYEIPADLQFHSTIEDFFSDAWNAQRLSDFMGLVGPHASIRKLFSWLLMLSASTKRIETLASQFRALDYELLEVSTAKGLSRIKKFRATVGALRKSIEMCRGYNAHRLEEDAYTVLRDAHGTREEQSNNGSLVKSPSMTARQLASFSLQDEYRWIDQEVASVLPLLDQSLNLLILQHSVEQVKQKTTEITATKRLSEKTLKLAERSAELADAMKKDLANSTKNSERSTVMILLAAVYLLLIMATSRSSGGGIGSDHQPPWWSVVLAGLCLICLTSLLLLMFLTRKRIIQHSWEQKIHRLSGDWWGVVEVEEVKGEKQA